MKKPNKNAVRDVGTQGESRASAWHPVLVGMVGVGVLCLLVALAPIRMPWAEIPIVALCAVAVLAPMVTRRLGIHPASGMWRKTRRQEPETHRKFLTGFYPRRGLSTGVWSVDVALKGTGWPPGCLSGIRAVDLDRWVSKTLLLYSIAAAQERGDGCVWIGSEIDPARAARVGVDLSRLRVVTTDVADPFRLLEVAEGLVTSADRLDLVVIESIHDHPNWAAARSVLSRFVHSLQRTRVACVYALHTTHPPSSTADRSLRFHSATRLRLKGQGPCARRDIARIRVSVSVMKSRAYGNNTVTLDVTPSHGITAHRVSTESLIALGLEHRVLTRLPQSGGVLLGSKSLGEDGAAASQYLADQPRTALDLQMAIWAKMEKILDGPRMYVYETFPGPLEDAIRRLDDSPETNALTG